MPEELIGMLLRTAFRSMVLQVELEFDATDISLSQWIALRSVRDRQAHCIGDVARLLGYDTGSTTRLIDQLERRHLLRRIRHLTDRRVVTLEISADGLTMLKAMDPLVRRFWATRLANFSSIERRTLVDLLGRLGEALALPADDCGFPFAEMPG